MIGTEYVVNATDGHTLLLGTQSSILPKFTTKNLKFDPTTDLVPVYKVINYQLVVAANDDTAGKAKTMRGLVDLSRRGSDGLFFAGTGRTSIFNLTMALLNKSLGMKYAPIDFNSVTAMNMAVMRDDAQFLVNTPSSMKSQMEAGKLRPMAAISAERYADLPSVPTLSEAVGYKGYLPLLWAGMFVPKSTPPAVVDRIARDLRACRQTRNQEYGGVAPERQHGGVVTGRVLPPTEGRGRGMERPLRRTQLSAGVRSHA